MRNLNRNSSYQLNKRSWHRLMIVIVILILYQSPVIAQEKVSLVGGWKVDSEETLSGLDQEREERFSAFTEQTKTKVRYSLNNRIYDFKRDGVLLVSLKRDNEVKISSGKWEFDKSTNELKVILSGGARYFNVVWQSVDRVLLQKKFDDSNSVFSGLVLYRIK